MTGIFTKFGEDFWADLTLTGANEHLKISQHEMPAAEMENVRQFAKLSDKIQTRSDIDQLALAKKETRLSQCNQCATVNNFCLLCFVDT